LTLKFGARQAEKNLSASIALSTAKSALGPEGIRRGGAPDLS
jgi:hypothetical protein